MAHVQIDWTCGRESLDKELHALFPSGEIHKLSVVVTAATVEEFNRQIEENSAKAS